ncbi:MAG TPA: hypothetical protein VGH87_08865 [Polyangiaceae bacterium]
MRSLLAFSALVIVGCSAAPQDPHEDAGFPILVADAGSEPDAKADAKTDAHADADAAAPKPSCPNVPADVSKFSPTAPKLARAYQAACGSGQVTAFYNACIATSATTYSCQSWETASQSNNSCAACMISNDYESAWGPIVNHLGYSFINQMGCAELLTQNPAPSGTCAYDEWADLSCAMAACDTLCASDGLYELNQCEQNAIANGCKSYDDAETAACETTQGAFSKCFVTDPQTRFVNIASTFCGGS